MHYLEWKLWTSLKISLKFVPMVRINNIPALVQIMAWRLPGAKLFYEPMMVSLLTHICVTRPQWVKLMLQKYNVYPVVNKYILTQQKICRANAVCDSTGVPNKKLLKPYASWYKAKAWVRSSCSHLHSSSSLDYTDRTRIHISTAGGQRWRVYYTRLFLSQLLVSRECFYCFVVYSAVGKSCGRCFINP